MREVVLAAHTAEYFDSFEDSKRNNEELVSKTTEFCFCLGAWKTNFKTDLFDIIILLVLFLFS